MSTHPSLRCLYDFPGWVIHINRGQTTFFLFKKRGLSPIYSLNFHNIYSYQKEKGFLR